MAELGESLSERELEVLNCLAKGSGNKEIATELHISGNTVKVHLRNIYTKLGASSRTEATAVALQQGLITLPGMDAAPSSQISEDYEAKGEGRWTRRTMLLLATLLLAIALLAIVSIFAVRQTLLTAVTATPEPFEPNVVGENWKSLRPLPAARQGMAATALGLNVYLVGGETADGVDGSVLIYNTTDYTWQEAAEKPTAVSETSAAGLFGEIYVPGGRLADGSPTEIVEVYSPSNDSWRTVAPLLEPVSGGLVLSDGNFLYLIGGWNGRDYLNTAYVYDPGAEAWQELPPMKQARANLVGGAVKGNLYVVGGTDGNNVVNTCEFFDPIEQAWNDCPPMLEARSGGGAVSIANKLYVIGGQHSDDPAVFGEFYNPELEEWVYTEPVEFLDQAQLAAHGVTNVETSIFVLGGLKGDELIADSYLYAPLVYTTYFPSAPFHGE